MLDYLKVFGTKCNREKLLEIKQEKEKLLTKKQGLTFIKILDSLPVLKKIKIDIQSAAVRVDHDNISEEDLSSINQAARDLIPWRKGPFHIFNTYIDAEWRSDLKWNRLKLDENDLKDKVVLDIGCNNGHFMFKMDQYRPSLVLGIDPVLPCWAQFKFVQHFIQSPRLHFELFGVEHLAYFHQVFDLIFSMGIIYHHKDPLNQLIQIRESLKPGGTLILETIGIKGEGSYALFPENQYTKMKNIWFIPTLECLINWVKKAKFIEIEVLSVCKTTENEQRLTKWCPPPIHNFKDFLDPTDNEKTIEGHLAPYRFCLKMKKASH